MPHLHWYCHYNNAIIADARYYHCQIEITFKRLEKLKKYQYVSPNWGLFINDVIIFGGYCDLV